LVGAGFIPARAELKANELSLGCLIKKKAGSKMFLSFWKHCPKNKKESLNGQDVFESR
jgi:hypothetical protein